MINFITLGVIASLVLIVVTFYFYKIKGIDSDLGEILKLVSIILLIATVAATAMFTVFTYNSAISLPYKFVAAEDNLKMTMELLTKIDDVDPSSTSVGYGLQEYGNKLRTQYKVLIEKRNKIKQDIDIWLNNPLMPFKDILLDRLPNDY